MRDGRSAPTNALGSAPADVRTCTSQPDVVLLPCVPATAMERPVDGRVRDHLLPRLDRDVRVARGDEFRVIRVDGGEGLGDGQRSGAGDVRTCAAACAHSMGIPAASTASVYGEGPPGSQPVTVAPAWDARIAAALAPAPATPTTWMRSPGLIARAARAGASPAPIARGHSPTRSRASSRAAAALSSWLAARSPVQR